MVIQVEVKELDVMVKMEMIVVVETDGVHFGGDSGEGGDGGKGSAF